MKQLDLKECSIFGSDSTIFFDVDDTLILWDKALRKGRKDIVTLEDPGMPGHIMKFVPHIAHIHILKRNFARGQTVVVWSAAGWRWAKAVIEALHLTDKVSLILDKPTCYVDDIPMEEWKPRRIYLPVDIERPT